MPRINTTIGPHYTGMGDLISLAWVAEGTRDSEDPLTFYATHRNYALLKLLGQDVTDDPAGTGILISTAYVNELKEGGAKLRLDYVRELLGIDKRPARPRVHIPTESLNWANETAGNLGKGDLVLLFPQTLWESRAWPACYWVELAWRLNERNVTPLIMLAHEDKRFANTPHFFWGFDLNKVAALMSVAKLVIGNDSGPAHLSSTMRVPTIVTVGPTRSECVFGHIPEVIALKTDEPPNCAGCHFKPPFRAACDQGCQALYALKPHVVLARAISELSLISGRLPAATNQTTSLDGAR